MAATLTNVGERQVLRHLLRGESISSFRPLLALAIASATMHEGLADISSANIELQAGNSLLTPTYAGGYARVDITALNLSMTDDFAFASADITNYTVGPIMNHLDIQFNPATTNWPSVGYWMLLNDVTQQVYAYGDFTTALTLIAGNQLVLRAGEFGFTIT